LPQELESFSRYRKLLFCPTAVVAFRDCLLKKVYVFLRISMLVNMEIRLNESISMHQLLAMSYITELFTSYELFIQSHISMISISSHLSLERIYFMGLLLTFFYMAHIPKSTFYLTKFEVEDLESLSISSLIYSSVISFSFFLDVLEDLIFVFF
jgi:hypothetical protein